MGLGNFLFTLDVNQQSQRRMAFQFFQAGVERLVPQHNGQQQRSSQDMNGIVVAPLATGSPHRIEQSFIGN